MAKLNFPGSPSPGTIYTENGNAWQWNGNSWVSFNSLDLTSQVSGALGVTYGGTGYSTYSTGTLLVGAGSSFIRLIAGPDNFVLTASSSSSSGITWSPPSSVSSGSGLSILNSLTSGIQYFSTGTSGNIFNISSSGSTHTFNIPIAGVASTGLISTSSQTIAGQKTFTSAIVGDLIGTATTSGFATTANYSHQSGYAITSSSSGIASTSTYALQAGYAITSGTSSTANTATYSHQSGYGLTSGLATTASYSHQSGYAITSGSSNTSGFATTASYSYQSGYGLTSGLATTAFYSHQSGYAITSNSSGTATTSTYSHQSGYAITSASSATATTSTYSHQAGYAITSGLSSTANTATYSHQSGYGLTAGFATTANYSYQSGYGMTSGLATTATYSLQSGYAVTSGIATTTRSVNTVSANTSASHYLLFSPTDGGSGVAVSSDSNLTYNPSTNVITANTFSGNVSATAVTSTNFFGTFVGNSSTATTSQNVNLASGSNNSNHSIVFSLASSGSGVALSSDGDLQYNPSSNSFTVGTGNISANSVRIGNSSNTIDTSSGNLTIDSTGGQINLNDNVVVQGNLTVQGTTLTVDSTITTLVDPVIVVGSGVGGTHSTVDNNQDRGVEFRYSNGGTATTGFFGFQDTDYKFRYIPNASLSATNVYSGNVGVIVANIEGNLTGTAVTSTNFYGTFVGNSSTATTAQNLNINATTINSTHYITFVPSSSGSGLASSTDLDLTYNPGSNVLTAGVFSGNVSGTAITATNIYGIHVGNVTGTSTTSQNINTVSANTSATHYLLFSPVNGASGVAVSSDSSLQYNPSTNVIVADVFSGNLSGTAVTATNLFGTLTGNVSGTSTTSQNVNVVSATTNSSHAVLFTPASGSASGAAVSTESSFVYNPSTDILSISGLAVTSTTTSRSTSSGALIVTGGVGIGGSLYVTSATAISGISINNGILSASTINTSSIAATSSTNSTTTSTGALTVTGGVGIGQSVSVGGRLQLFNGGSYTAFVSSASGNTVYTLPTTTPSTGSSVLQSTSAGVMSWVPMTATGGLAVSGTTDGSVQYKSGSSLGATNSFFFDTNLIALRLSGFPAGNLTSGTDAVLKLEATTSSFNGSTNGTYIAVNAGSGFTGDLLNLQVNATSRFRVDSSGSLIQNIGTNSSSTTSGSLQVRGGVGITGAVYIGESVNATSLTQSTSTNNGSLVVSGGAGISAALNVGGVTRIFSSTASTSPSTGALLVAGGLGVSGQLSFVNAALGFTGITTNPSMAFIGATSSAPITLTVLTDNSLSWEGTSGQLFSIDNNLASGEIFAVSDISGLPVISASAGQTINLNEFGGYTQIGNGTINSSSTTSGSLVIAGGLGMSGNAYIGGTAFITNTVSSSGTSSGSLINTGGFGNLGNAFIGGTTTILSTTSSSGTSSGSLVNTGGFGNLGNAFIGGTTAILSTTSSLSTLSGSLVNSGGFGNAGNAFIGGTTTITNTTNSTSTATGALVVRGGLGLSGNTFIGGISTITNSTSSTSTSTGSLVNTGGFGNQGNAFIGGTTTITNSTNSTSSATGALVVSGGAGFGRSVYVGGNIVLSASLFSGGTSYTKNLGNGDIAFDNGTADTPGSIYYWQNNRNFGTDVFFSGAGVTRYRIVKELNEAGGTELWSIDREGIVYRSAWAVGETINTAMYNYSDLSMASTTTINSASYTTIATISYTPKSSTSYLWIEFSCTYTISGSTADDFWSNIEVNAGEIVNSNQVWLNASGGGTRSGVLFPLAARYTNTGTSALTITVRMKRGSSDDNGTVYGNAGSGYMRIQEIGR